ncbi:hypothetical protein CTI12_AA407060 [Artemisia annua]|uniref:Uncharacterized protein n=1 Tax=Artemisia annua TaxID=35608 RepID=A0A2U1M8W2_ARTAN|nr:hypothetical protein CTI12_AA407060 [Artemisia annua]
MVLIRCSSGLFDLRRWLNLYWGSWTLECIPTLVYSVSRHCTINLDPRMVILGIQSVVLLRYISITSYNKIGDLLCCRDDSGERIICSGLFYDDYGGGDGGERWWRSM